MITNEKILELASQHLYCNMSVVEWSGRNEDILNFALAIADIEYDRGFDDGWESRADAEYLNSSYPVELVGEPGPEPHL